MLHHVSFGVNDIRQARKFYDQTLACLGYQRVWDAPGSASEPAAAGYGVEEGEDLFAIKQKPGSKPPGAGFHLAFSAPSRQAVLAFYRAALENGGSSMGEPGLRPHYGPDYFAAFVTDPDGHLLEAVCIGPA